jgi:hypothetical protein
MQTATSLTSSVTPLKLIATIPAPLLTAAKLPALPPMIILFGRDERGRPHGSKFEGRDKMKAERAALLMGFQLAAADTDALRDLGAKLPVGRIFPASGKAFVPFVKTALFDRLIAATGAPDAPRAASAPTKAAEGGPMVGGGQGRGAGGGGAGDPPAKAQAPADWSKIEIGSFVLAQGDDGDDGYYAAKVNSVGTDDKCGLVWVNYADLPRFTRARKALALMHPEAVAGLT